MLIHDRIYGTVDIKEPVLIELLHSRPVVRLKKINQAGASQYLYSWKNISRFDHSVGVMLLLRLHGANLAEQVAGLLHDIPHTAFSHVADFVFANERHDFHEKFHEQMIRESEILGILKKNQLPKTVIHPEKFTLLERPIPDMCADRIDYALRDHLAWKNDREAVMAKLVGLTVRDNEFIFKDQYSAEAFATEYIIQDQSGWSDPREIAVYMLLAQAIQHAISKNILNLAGLFTDDETVMEILRRKGDPYIHKKLQFLNPRFRVEKATKEHHHLFVKSKVRYVDPKILIQDKVRRLSEISPRFNKILKKHIEYSKQGKYLDVFSH